MLSRAGALVARRNRANLSMSDSPSGPGLSLGSVTVLQTLVTSSGNSVLVMPISFRYASPENDSTLACWSFQPNRPTPVIPGDSTTGTNSAWPWILPWVRRRWSLAIWSNVASETASTSPSPSRLSDARSVLIVSMSGARSWISLSGKVALGQMLRSFTRVRP